MRLATLLIGLDGATFSILDPLMRAGVMPFVRDLVAAGVRAALRSVIPALTPPGWASLMTGRSPGQHGIFDFFRKVSPHSHHLRLLTSRDVGCETIWSMASRYGRRTTVLNFPLTFPPPALNGHVVPGGLMPWRQLRLGCHPSGLYDRLKELPGFNLRELAMDAVQEEKAIEGCRHDEYEAWIAYHIRREQQWFNVARYLMREDPAELTAIVFDGVDKLQHLCWRFLDPAYAGSLMSPWEERVRERCLEYFRTLDALLADLVTLAGPEASVILASDHGFGPQVRTFFANSWLERQGYLAWADGSGPRASDTRTLGVGQIARHVYLLDWARTKTYAPLPSGNGIHIVRTDGGRSGGVPPSEYEAFRDRLVGELEALRDPSGGEPVVASVWRREQIFAGPYLELAPDLTLELQDGGFLSILASESPVASRPEPRGTHRPDGIFVAGGPAFHHGAQLPVLSILDVAPLILWSLGLPIPANLDGRIPLNALDPAALRRRPVQAAALSNGLPVGRPAADTESGLDEETEREILRRLRALGYLE